MGARFLWVFTSFRGRIGRQVYWLAWIGVDAIIGAILFSSDILTVDMETGAFQMDGGSELFSLIFMISLVLQVIISVKRLHDFGFSGYYAVVLMIPTVNFIAALALGFIPGKAGPNQYGERPDVVPPPVT